MHDVIFFFLIVGCFFKYLRSPTPVYVFSMYTTVLQVAVSPSYTQAVEGQIFKFFHGVVRSKGHNCKPPPLINQSADVSQCSPLTNLPHLIKNIFLRGICYAYTLYFRFAVYSVYVGHGLVNRGVLTLVREIPGYINDRGYYN